MACTGDGGSSHLRHCLLRLLDDPSHHGHRLHREVAVGGLPAEHHHVGAVQHCVGDIACLGPGGEGLVLHRREHLGGRDHNLASLLRLLDHPLLRHPYLLHWDLHAQVTSGNHDPVGHGQDLVVVFHALDILDLRYDLDVGAAVLPAIQDVLRALHEAQRDVVGLRRDGPLLDVLDLALVNDRQVDLDAGHVNVFLLAELALVSDLAHNEVVSRRRDVENDSAVLHQDLLAHLDVLGQPAIGDRDVILVALDTVVCNQLELLASLQHLLGVVHLEVPRPDLRAPGVHQHLDGTSSFRPHLVGLLKVL
mmetsp:Transcript_15896/g.42125  ORF Transcript_15896/g.42125 Transcript_15896/m.42125 type:complete len:307 (-) Transcript_15896:357-1277(-)